MDYQPPTSVGRPVAHCSGRRAVSAAIRRAGAAEWLAVVTRRAWSTELLVTVAGRAQSTAIYPEPTPHAALEPGDRPAAERTLRSRVRPSVHWPQRTVYFSFLLETRAGLKPAARWRQYVPISDAGGLPQRQQAGQAPKSHSGSFSFRSRRLWRGSQLCRGPSGEALYGSMMYSHSLPLRTAKSTVRAAVSIQAWMINMGATEQPRADRRAARGEGRVDHLAVVGDE